MNAMKHTNIAWIGDIPSEWTLSKVKTGFDRKKEKSTELNPVVLSLARAGVKVRDISTNEGQLAASYEGYNPVEPNDLLLNPMDLISGANCSISHVSGVISPAYMNLRAKEGFDPRYYDYYFKTQYWCMALFAHGKGVSFDNRWTLNESTLMNYWIPKPSYLEQQAISDYLDEKCSKIDEIIAGAIDSIEVYKKLKEIIITELVSGVIGTVNLTKSSIEYLGVYPDNWKIIPISQLFSFIGGYAYKSDRFIQESKFQVIRMGNVKNDMLLLDANPVYINSEDASLSSKAKLKENDILFTMTGTKGKGDYMYTLLLRHEHLQDRNLYLNQRVGCFRKKYHNLYMPYYNYLLKSQKVREYIFLFETGTANQGNIGIECLNRIKLYNPPYDEQVAITTQLDKKICKIDNLIFEKQSLIEDLQAYKKSLIYEVVTGKRRIL